MTALRTVRPRTVLLDPGLPAPGSVAPTFGSGLVVAGTPPVVAPDFGTGHNQVARGDAVSGGTGAIVISSAALPSTLNASVEGTIDWMVLTETNQPRIIIPGYQHAKATGGWLLESFDWIVNGAGLATYGAGPLAITSEAGDDLATTALAAWNASQHALQFGSGTGMGCRLRVPADSYNRVLRLYLGGFSAEYTATARLTDGSVAPVSQVFDTTPATWGWNVFEIAYHSARDGQELIVTVQCSVNHGSVPNFVFLAATLATS